MNGRVTIVVGAQWGDEGKGKITHLLSDTADYVVRFGGGNNAGHTIVVGNETYKLHLLPSGALSPHTVSVIGNGVVIQPEVLYHELESLKQRGIEPTLLVSERAHVIMPYHIALDAALDGYQGTLAAGSTKRGIAPAYADKAYRQGIRMGDLLDKDLLKSKLEKAYHFHRVLLEHLFNFTSLDPLDHIYHTYLGYGELLRPYICDTEFELSEALTLGQHILFEGAQGMSLDIDHGMYPYTTSVNTVADHSGIGSGIALPGKKEVIGVVKAYVSRVGQSPFVTELDKSTGNIIRTCGAEFGTNTGRPRRIGWLDLVQLRQASRVNGLTKLALTKIDVLHCVKEIRVCVAYKIHGRICKEMPSRPTDIEHAVPLYVTFPSWPEMTASDKQRLQTEGFVALHPHIQAFISFIEEALHIPISLISYGPEKNDTLVRTI